MRFYLNFPKHGVTSTKFGTKLKLRLPPTLSSFLCQRVEQYQMSSSRALRVLNGTAATSDASQPPPSMKQPMSRISSMRRDWNDVPPPSQNTQIKVTLSQDTDPFPWSKSPSPEPKSKAKADTKPATVRH